MLKSLLLTNMIGKLLKGRISALLEIIHNNCTHCRFRPTNVEQETWFYTIAEIKVVKDSNPVV